MMAAMPSTPMTRMAPHARLFVALWPDEALRGQLLRVQADWRWPQGAARVPAEKLHLTLHFIGAVERGRIAELAQALTGVRVEPVELLLDAAELWTGGVAVLRAGTVPAGLERMHRAVRETAERMLGVPGEARRFKPHVTLARKASGAMAPAQPVALRWASAGMALVASAPGPTGGYAVLQAYSAGAAAADTAAPARGSVLDTLGTSSAAVSTAMRQPKR